MHGFQRAKVRPQAPLRRLAESLVLAALALPLAVASPTLTNVTPPGGQRGSAVRLALEGNGLQGKIRVHSGIPGALTELSAAGSSRQYLLEIAPDAPPGAYPLAVQTRDGLTNAWLFRVSDLPETSETDSRRAPNDRREQAQALQPPTVVNGTLGEADRDVYSVPLRAGQRIVFEVEARRLGSAIDPVLALRDPDGRLAARNDDAPGIGGDARLTYAAPADGTYFVELHDARFSKQRLNFYRLVVGPVEFGEAIFPLGWTAGEAVRVEVSGGTLDAPRTVTVTGDRIALPGPGASLPVPFLRSEAPETLEPAARRRQRRLSEGTVVNGRIENPDEIDRYRLQVRAGEEWMIETQGAILGTSQLYTLLTIRDQDGRKLGSAGDQPPEELLSNISTRAETFGDPALGLRVPEGVTELEVSVQDLLGRGGPGYGYRLFARRQPPDFIVRLDDTRINVPQEGSASVRFTLDRRGYLGPVRIVAEGLPEGVSAQGGHVPAEFGGMTTQRDARNGRLILTANADAAPSSATVSFYAEGRAENGSIVRRRVLTSLIVTPVAGPKQRALRIPNPLATIEATVAAPAPASLEVQSGRAIRLIQGLSHDIRWAYRTREPAVQAVSAVNLANAPAVANLRILGGAKIKPGDTSGVFEMNTTMGTPAMRFDLVLEAQVRHDGVAHTIASPAIAVDIVQGYAVEAPREPVTAPPGADFAIEGGFSREPEFDAEVVVEAANLPVGVTCQARTIPDSPAAFSLPCRADASVAPGEYRAELAPRSVLAGRGKEAVPYNIPAVEFILVIADGHTIALNRSGSRRRSP